MFNPLVRKPAHIIAYVCIWLLISVIQIVFFNYYLDIDLQMALVDAVVYNGLMAAMGFLLWFVLRFRIMNQQNRFDLLVNHSIVAVVFISFWTAVGYYLLLYFEKENLDYVLFLEQSLPWRVVVGVFFYVIFISFYYSNFYYENLQKKLLVENELNQLVKEAQLNALKAQINPHFLFNSLNSISSLTMSDPEKAQEMLIKLSDFMRYSLSSSRNEQSTLGNELKNIERYLDIEKIRFGNRLRLFSDVDPKFFGIQIPNLILQPLFENAIKHGVHNSTEEILIALQALDTAQGLELHINNNFDPESTHPKGEGIGLRNIRNRMALLYGRNDLVRVAARKEHFEVVLLIPNQSVS